MFFEQSDCGLPSCLESCLYSYNVCLLSAYLGWGSTSIVLGSCSKTIILPRDEGGSEWQGFWTAKVQPKAKHLQKCNQESRYSFPLPGNPRGIQHRTKRGSWSVSLSKRGQGKPRGLRSRLCRGAGQRLEAHPT